jgi:nucleoside-diphosphate-sugar epimerase
MKILLTGASSFTGYWFAKELEHQGHEVSCALTEENLASYAKKRSYRRVQLLASEFQLIFGIRFGEPPFCELLAAGRFDVICLHGAYIPNYRSGEFNIAESLYKNLLGIHNVFSLLAKKQTPVVLTGTVYETNEGEGGKPTEPGSPYGLAKSLISQTFQYYGRRFKVPMAKLVIANPFGCLEDNKFTTYLMDCWSRGEVAKVKTPLYVRDNIHVQLLALVYAELVARRFSEPHGTENLYARPSGYCESQGEFTARFAREIRNRTGLACEFELAHQVDFPEPQSRLNSEPVMNRYPDFSEKYAWDQLVEHYKTI